MDVTKFSSSRIPVLLNPSSPTPTPPASSRNNYPTHSHNFFRYIQLSQSDKETPGDHFDVQLDDNVATPHSPTNPQSSYVAPTRTAPTARTAPSQTSLGFHPLPNTLNERLRSPLTPHTTSSLPLHHAHQHPPSFQRFHSHVVQMPSVSTRNFTCSIPQRVKPWMPFILWAMTSIGFLLAITVWRTELFQGLDDLSHYLRSENSHGHTILFLCIFITTFPPLPLYSTFIILSGYTFGAWMGFIISYCAALSGAVVVYLGSLHFLRDYISDVLNNTGWIKQVVRAIERRPKLLFLIRVAPYPYNLLNALLAASPTLSFRTYFTCTALSLFKLIIHTTVGSTIHEFAEYHTSEKENEGNSLARYWSLIGITLCIGIFLYLTYLARKAVQEEGSLDADQEAGFVIDGQMSEVTGSSSANNRS